MRVRRIHVTLALATALACTGALSGCRDRARDPGDPSVRAWALHLADDDVVIRSDDGGATWTEAARFPYDPERLVGELADIGFADAERGWAVGGNLLLETTDGGSSWADVLPRVPIPADVRPRLFAIAVDASGTAVAVGDELPLPPPLITGPPLIFRTADRGASWAPARIDPAIERVVTLHDVCLSSGVGIATGNGTQGNATFRTRDGGATWQEITARVGGHEVACAQGALWVMSMRGLARSTDAGESWSDLSSGVPSRVQYLGPIAFADPDHGWAGGFGDAGSLLLHSQDGGASWRRQALPRGRSREEPGAGVADMAFVSPSRGVAVGARGGVAAAFHTGDGGATWLQAVVPELVGTRFVAVAAVAGE
ncbi:MAG: YCF48-related protein [Thermodesulfobacteriota bacterium]